MGDNYMAVILEEIRDQNRAVLEAVGMLQQDVTLLAKQSDLEEVKQDVKTIKAALKDTNHEVRDHESRITRLESSAQQV